MTFGLAPSQPPRETPHSEQVRVLWRAERRRDFTVQIITAAIYKHSHGQELRVFIEPEDKNDLLWSSVERLDFTPLEQNASHLRAVLLEKGWTELQA